MSRGTLSAISGLIFRDNIVSFREAEEEARGRFWRGDKDKYAEDGRERKFPRKDLPSLNLFASNRLCAFPSKCPKSNIPHFPLCNVHRSVTMVVLNLSVDSTNRSGCSRPSRWNADIEMFRLRRTTEDVMKDFRQIRFQVNAPKMSGVVCERKNETNCGPDEWLMAISRERSQRRSPRETRTRKFAKKSRRNRKTLPFRSLGFWMIFQNIEKPMNNTFVIHRRRI